MALLNKGLPRSLKDLYDRMTAVESSTSDPYSDTKARNAIKTKTQIAALTSSSTAAEIVAALQA